MYKINNCIKVQEEEKDKQNKHTKIHYLSSSIKPPLLLVSHNGIPGIMELFCSKPVSSCTLDNFIVVFYLVHNDSCQWLKVI